ncbi:MAG: patatin-like phospholipase family protein [Parasphingopyxis sp.]|uniref:patatin-like phospholipase family protein n=1 Tax=Parasphingopyxis sp. TaxID=1920299 RepID=UPI003FA171E5
MRETDRNKPALALSGGGFRATLFHIGALLRLNEIGLLGEIERIASVSGGSIAAGRLAVKWRDLIFDAQGRVTNFDEMVAGPLRAFCRMNVDRSVIIRGSIDPFRSIGEKLAKFYDKYLMEDQQLEDLPDFPQFVFKATNLQTGRMVRLSKKRIADYRLGEIPFPKDVRVSMAVAASSAFPPVLSPVRIKTKADQWSEFEGADLFGNPLYNGELVLTDGGAYDNIGLETVDSFKTIMASDAGAPFAYDQKRSAPWTKQLKRVLDIATDQSRGLRKRLLFSDARVNRRRFGYWGIDQDWSAGDLRGALPADFEITSQLARIRTRLDRFDEREQAELINWGYAACDQVIRRFILPDAAPPSGWPEPRYPLG